MHITNKDLRMEYKLNSGLYPIAEMKIDCETESFMVDIDKIPYLIWIEDKLIEILKNNYGLRKRYKNR